MMPRPNCAVGGLFLAQATGALWIDFGIAAVWLAIAAVGAIGFRFTRELPRLRLPLALLLASCALFVVAALPTALPSLTTSLPSSPIQLVAALLLLIGFALLPRHWLRTGATVRSLAEAEQAYRALFEQAADGLYQTSPDGRILRANTAMARILGYDSTESLANARIDWAGARFPETVCCATDRIDGGRAWTGRMGWNLV